MAQTMLDRYGRVKLTQLVSSFYSDVLHSTLLAPYFEEVSIEGLIEHQTRFMAMVMGGPPAYTRLEIQDAHRRFGITEHAFDEMLRLLEKSLVSFEVDLEDIAQVMSRYRDMQSSVVNPPSL
jgi:hemoglobin